MSDDFKKRLERAIERGQKAAHVRAQEAAAQSLSEDELRRLHSQHRLGLSEHVEVCLRQLADNVPGFQFESIVDERGWGAAVTRDDLRRGERRPENFFSRLELVVRPFSSYHVLELAAKGTIRNKEVFNRNHYQMLGEVRPDSLKELADLWVLEYAELFAAKS